MSLETVPSTPNDDESREAPTSERRSKALSINIEEPNRLSSDAVHLDQSAYGGLEDPRLTQNPGV
jgi:hypothetical protein